MFKRILFSEAKKLIQIGRVRAVQQTDCLSLPVEINPENIFWDESKLDWSSRKSFFKTLLKISWPTSKFAILFQVIGSLLAFSVPFIVHSFLIRLQAGVSNQNQLTELILIAIALGVVGGIQGLTIQHYFFRTLQFNQIITNIINKKIFSHSLKLTAAAKNKFQVGDVVNFMSTDSDAIADSCITVIDLANACSLLIGCTISLFYFIGWSAIIAVVVMAILMPVTQSLSKKFMHLEDQMLAYRDQRMTLMTQVMNAIRVVKYFTWEKSILEEVSEVRRQEIHSRYLLAKAEISWGVIYTSISTIVLFVALLTHTLRGFELDYALIFTCISIFSLMEDHFGGLSKFISRLINIAVSTDRILAFLKSETISDQLIINSDQDSFIQINNLNFSYSEKNNLIKNLNLSLKKQQSLAIIGPVGSGKSTLLQILLSELQPQSGSISFKSQISKAFVSQDAFIVNASLKQNIIFGSKNNSEEEIQNALHVSALEYDLMAWPAGLQTEIGEKGVNLSGGQKQRVSLARAVLADAELIILDDPLSAVDPATEKILTDRLLFGHWREKTRLVVTHRLDSLNRFDKILFLQDSDWALGTFDELLKSHPPFQGFLQTHQNNKSLENESAFKTKAHERNESIVSVESSRITEDEDRSVGAVEKTVYSNYIKALGGDGPNQKWILILLFFAAIAVVASPMLQKIWLSQSKKIIDLSPLQMILIYGFLGLFTILISFISNWFWTYQGIKAGQLFHDKMLKSVLMTRIRFFDSTPVGRILQRFSRDVEAVDMQVQWSFDHTIHALFQITISFLLIIFVLPAVIIFLIPVLFIYYRVQNDYRRVAREIKRLDSVARSPRYAHFKETLQGLQVIRSFGQANWAMEQFYSRLKFSTQMFYTHYMVNRWFSARIPLIGAAISTATTLMVVFTGYNGLLSAGTAGLVTLYALEFWRHLNWGVRIFSDLESRMTSVERVNYYANLQPEELEINNPAPKNWPQSGELEFKHVHVRYADHLPLVLKNVSFKIPSGARAGLIGRTGSGKSTIFQTVYRFVDIESGDILLDGVSIQKLPLYELRKNLAVIPQDPSLFLGTLRSNIDRYQQASDQQIWEILKKVSLEKFVLDLPDQLNFKVTESGSNLSQGQRQLICLARALLLKVKIIFLDEATASVDVETDAIIQKVIRQSLEGITLVTIAHRLSTLDGYDMVIELQNGQIV